MQISVRLLCYLMLALLTASACSRQDPLYIGGEDSVTSPIYLQVTPAQAEINVATSQQYSAWQVDPESGTREDVSDLVSWSVSETAIANVDANGRTTGTAAGNSEVIATLDGLSASSNLSVINAVLVEVSVLPPEQVSLIDMDRQFYAIARYDDGHLQDVTADVSWASSDSVVATVDDSGLASSRSQGSSNITATLQTLSGDASLAVLNATPVAFSVSPAQTSLPTGATEQLTANVLLSTGEVLDVSSQVTWSSSAATVAAVSNQTGNKGLVSGLDAGYAEIIASANFAGTTVADSATVTVTAPTLLSLNVTPLQASIPAGTRGNLTATAIYSDNSARDVTKDAIWQSSDDSIAFVEASGDLAGQGQALSQGSASISASFGGLSAQSNITVTSATLTALQITPLQESVTAGSAVQYYASGFYSDGSSHDLTQAVEWQSTNSTIANMDTSGVAHTLSTGSVTISAALDNLQSDASLTVTNATVVSIEVGPPAIIIQSGSTQPYRATAVYSNNTRRDITTLAFWQSGNESAAVISNIGIAKGVGAGNAIISASYSGQTGNAALRVTESTLEELLIVPQDIRLQTGTVQQYSAVGIFSDHIEDLTEQATWQVSNGSLATISNTTGSKGKLTTVAPGTLDVTTTYSGQEASTTLVVTQPQMLSLAVACNDTTIISGYNTWCESIATYADGRSQNVTQESSWSSSDSDVARVENLPPPGSPGKVTGSSAGTADITATLNGISDNQTITVQAVSLVSIDVSSYNNVLTEEEQEQFYATGQFSDGSSADLTLTAFWETADSGVLTISNITGAEGLATAVAAGTTTVTATQDGVVGTSAVITVQAPPPSDNVRKVQILCLNGEFTGPININVGETDRCKAYAINKDDTVDDVTALASWSVDQPDTLSIVGLTADSEYLEVLGEQRGNTILRAEYFKKAVINYKVH